MAERTPTCTAGGPWPALPFHEWQSTRDALHLWTQVIGKSLLACSPPQNHWWHGALRVSARGLVTPSLNRGDVVLDVELDLVDHALVVRSDRETLTLPLGGSVHAFHDAYLAALRARGVDLHLWPMPVEVPDPVPLDRDEVARPYDRDAAHRFLQVLRLMDVTLRDLADDFVGKQSPVLFFWGSFDLAATRFSGRRAPARPGADPVMREAYSHEVISFGFWPGGVTAAGVVVEEPVLFAYAAPEPSGFRDAPVAPASARYDERLGEFILPYESIRRSDDPARLARSFWRSVYEAGAKAGHWDREGLERGAP
jgi:hypothetical protein